MLIGIRCDTARQRKCINLNLEILRTFANTVPNLQIFTKMNKNSQTLSLLYVGSVLFVHKIL
jgi:hypothetical protein